MINRISRAIRFTIRTGLIFLFLGIGVSIILIGATGLMILLGKAERIASLNAFGTVWLIGALAWPTALGGGLSLASAFS